MLRFYFKRMKKTGRTLILKMCGLCILFILITLSSCRRDCAGTSPIVHISNYCDFDVDLEVDIIGDSNYVSILESGESINYHPGETKVKIKAGKYGSLVSLARRKSFETQNCKSYSVDFLQNDSSSLYRLNIEYDQFWN